MGIQLLDQNTINKIAAGEVIERPSSVVKELVENAIDAGATAVTVEAKEGGISFIRVTDNGSGIKKDEIDIAFKRHATSKIKSIEDLLTVSSLGFRGEALASIAAVSQIELITKTKDDITGTRYQSEGSEVISVEDIGAPDGTTFIIRNLFFNTPVRRKFLKSAMTEAGYINALMQYMALSHPEVSFRFINNNQNKLHTSGNMKLKDIIYNVYGRDITANLYDINAKTQDIKIEGYIGKPFINRGNRTYENYYINGRYIKSNIINKAIEEAYKGFIMPHNYPFTVIHFTISPDIIDVNVHPTKMELRFQNNEYVYNFVYDSILSTLKGKELVAKVEPDGQFMNKIHNDELEQKKAEEQKQMAGYSATGVQQNVPSDSGAAATQHNMSAGSGATVKQYGVPAGSGAINENKVIANESSIMNKTRLPEPFETVRSDKLIKEDIVQYNSRKAEESRQISLFEDKLLDEKNKNNYRIIGQLFDTYWLIEFEDRFYMMDQHAAHEKVLYEKTMNKLRTQKIDTQMLMPPIILTLNMNEEEVLKRNMSIFNKLGYEIEEFGGNEYKVTGIPAGFPKLDYRQMLTDLIDGLMQDGRMTDMDILTEKVASMSCKAAIKGNNEISYEEAKELMEKVPSEQKYMTSSCCPSFVKMIKKHVPAAESKISQTVSPMVACGLYVKELNPEAVTVFIGPCIAKKAEAYANLDAIDYAMTFEEMSCLLAGADIEADKMQVDEFNSEASLYGISFPVTCGVKSAVVNALGDEGKNLKTHYASGLERCLTEVKQLEDGKLDCEYFEGMACDRGCMDGPGSMVDYNIVNMLFKKYAAASPQKNVSDDSEAAKVLGKVNLDVK